MKDNYNWLNDKEVSELLGIPQESVEEKILVTNNGEEVKSSKANDIERKQVEVYPIEFQEFTKDEYDEELEKMKNEFQLLDDIQMEVRVVLARVKKTIEDVTEMKTGDIVSTERMAGEPVDVMVGNQMIAKGEIVIMEDKFGVIITEIVTPEERIRTASRKLGKTE